MNKPIDINSKDLLLKAMEATNDGIWVWHVPTGEAYFTPRYFTMLGYEPDEMEPSYETWSSLLHPDDSTLVQQCIDSHIKEKSNGYEVEFRMKKKAGGWLWILARGKVLEWTDDGHPEVIAGTHIDIDSKKQIAAEKEEQHSFLEQIIEERTKELKDALALLEATFDAIPDILGVQDNQHRMIRYNKAGYKLLGKSAEEIEGKTCFELVGRKAQCPHCATAETYLTKKPASVIHYEEHMGAWLDVRSYPILDENGNITKVIEHLRDITKEKKAEQERQELLEQLFHAKKMESLGNLAGGIAHDFNNFLMAIQGRISLITLAEDDEMSSLTEHLDAITGYINSTRDLTSKLIGLARGGKYEARPININDFLNENIKLFSRTHKSYIFDLEITDSPLVVKVDQTQLEQVMLNLYLNAVDAMESAGTLSLKAEKYVQNKNNTKIQLPKGEYCHISVKDTGCGMDQATAEKIFDPFFTTKTKGHGTGLGLASAYGIIENHDGTLTVESTIGLGSTFHIFLPLSDGKITAIEKTDEDICHGNETILLVDDENMIIEVHKKVLEKLGYNVITAQNREQAISSLEKHESEISMVLLDMIMPGVDIIETFESLKQVKPEVKILLCSGYAQDENAQVIMDKGGNGFIQKPFSVQLLSQKIRQILES